MYGDEFSFFRVVLLTVTISPGVMVLVAVAACVVSGVTQDALKETQSLPQELQEASHALPAKIRDALERPAQGDPKWLSGTGTQERGEDNIPEHQGRDSKWSKEGSEFNEKPERIAIPEKELLEQQLGQNPQEIQQRQDNQLEEIEGKGKISRHASQKSLDATEEAIERAEAAAARAEAAAIAEAEEETGDRQFLTGTGTNQQIVINLQGLVVGIILVVGAIIAIKLIIFLLTGTHVAAFTKFGKHFAHIFGIP